MVSGSRLWWSLHHSQTQEETGAAEDLAGVSHEEKLFEVSPPHQVVDGFLEHVKVDEVHLLLAKQYRGEGSADSKGA